ncbi:MAG TPA: amidohydrolase [Anaerolineaceae bacterium]|mgnify:FL=1|nr:amidohydrolase [Anaerolineaceae bacterium]HQH84643.1 amidohydrolase [Anaerolineaceae bacterium]
MQILYNAKIRTQNSKQSTATALAIEGGRIVAVGSDYELLAMSDRKAKKEDLGGRTIWPGLTDGHFHLEYYALGLQKVDVETETYAECLRRVSERTQKTPAGRWVLGHGWNQNLWPEGFGTAKDLDRAAPNHPVYLTAKSLHAGWANTAALRLAGITANTPNPEGGEIQRDAQGEPTGILLENAMDLLSRAIPTPTITDVIEAIRQAQPRLWQMGLTGGHDFDGPRCFAALGHLEAENALGLRILKGIRQSSLDAACDLRLRGGYGSEMLWFGAVKLFADGALGPQTAAMLTPYEGTEHSLGMALLTAEEIFEIGKQAAQSRLGLAIHAIGDNANRIVLDGYAKLRKWEKETGHPHLRHRIEHVQVLHPEDLGRLAELEIIASMQPIHATSDMEIADRYWGSRAALAYAFQSLLQSGARLSFGSDAPVESPNPFWGIHAAVTRRRMNGKPGPDGWRGEQRLNLQDALDAYTTGPAFAAGRENWLGQISPGFAADLIVLPLDPATMPPENLYTVQPDATMVNGNWVWSR